VALTGVSGQGIVGTPLYFYWTTIDNGQVPDWQKVNNSQVPDWANVEMTV
jgi:hypothetical protein